MSLETSVEGLSQEAAPLWHLDVEKPYDTTRCFGVMKTLNGWRLRGRIPLFLLSSLSYWTSQVHVGNSYSSVTPQEVRVLQCSVLSVRLFAVAINDLPSIICHLVQSFLFVDNFHIWYQASAMHSIEWQLHLALSTVGRLACLCGSHFVPGNTCHALLSFVGSSSRTKSDGMAISSLLWRLHFDCIWSAL